MSILFPTKDTFDQTVLESETPTLVEFYAPWCPYCRRIAPAFEAVANRHAEAFHFAQINIDDEPALEERYRIDIVPTMLLFKGGELIASAVNPGTQERIEALLSA